ncbi:MAG: GspH/FimT family pseudopilin [bacterium]
MKDGILAGEKGFTLIELVIVIVIMGAAMALAAPKIGKSLEKMQLRSAARRLSAVLRYARQMAISRKKEYTVTFPDDHTYVYLSVIRETGGDDGDQTVEDPNAAQGKADLGEQGIKDREVKIDLYEVLKTKDVSISCQDQGEEEPMQDESGMVGEIIFYPKGESSGGKITLAMKELNLAYQIDVDPITGRVKVDRATENE